MNNTEIRKAVSEAYKLRYPDWTDVGVTEIKTAAFGGYVAVVRAMIGGQPNEEMCHVGPDGAVHIFGATEDLVDFLHRENAPGVLERFLSGPAVVGLVFVGLFVVLAVLAFQQRKGSHDALVALTGAFGVAASFFFGRAVGMKAKR